MRSKCEFAYRRPVLIDTKLKELPMSNQVSKTIRLPRGQREARRKSMMDGKVFSLRLAGRLL